MNHSRKVVRHRPWHAWLLATIVFVLYVGGARDYVLIASGDTGDIGAQFGPGGLGYFADYPLVLRGLWALNILTGLAAPLLLLFRPRWSGPVAAIAAISQVVLLAVTFGFRSRWSALGATTSWFDIGVGVATFLFAVYSFRAGRRGAPEEAMLHAGHPSTPNRRTA